MSQRSRSVSWEDPLALSDAGRGLSGMENLQKLIRGELPPPPIAVLLNFRLTEVAEGRAVFVCDPAEYHYNPIGLVHGGLAATLLDSAMGCAVHSVLPAGVAYTTLEIKVNYLRPLLPARGRVTCEGTLIHRGNRTATADGRLTDADGRLYAHATTTCLLMEG